MSLIGRPRLYILDRAFALLAFGPLTFGSPLCVMLRRSITYASVKRLWYERAHAGALPEDWPLPLELFAIWLTIVHWKRDAS
jgi:hypothetical protein